MATDRKEYHENLLDSDHWHDRPASKKQVWALHCAFRVNTQGFSQYLSRKEASDFIEAQGGRELPSGKLSTKKFVKEELLMLVQVRKETTKKEHIPF